MKNAHKGRVWDNLKWYLLAVEENKKGKMKYWFNPEYMVCKYMSAVSKNGENKCAICKACDLGIIDGKLYPICTIGIDVLVR